MALVEHNQARGICIILSFASISHQWIHIECVTPVKKCSNLSIYVSLCVGGSKGTVGIHI